MAMKVRYFVVDGEMVGDNVADDYMRDALGSVTGTWSSSASFVKNTYRYKPYGTRLAKTGSAADPKFQWVGTAGYRETSIANSTSYIRARHYSQEAGRWTTVDPFWPNEQAYIYVRESPVNWIDPGGMQGIYLPQTSHTPTLKIINCQEQVKYAIQDLCNKFAGISQHQQKTINQCIKRTAGNLSASCQLLTDHRIECLNDFCKRGYVWCIENPNAGYAGKALGCTHRLGGDFPLSTLFVELNNISGSPLIEPATRMDGLIVTMIHEIGHTCGIQHEGKDQMRREVAMKDNQQCNDIFACCMNQVLNRNRDGRKCWEATWPGLPRGSIAPGLFAPQPPTRQ